MAEVTVLVPVYNGAAFVAETLDSIRAQRDVDLRVIVSLDKGDDDSEAACRAALGDRRVHLIVQPARRGWVGNVNALIAEVTTPYFCIAPHDDLHAPGYLAALLAAHRAHPGTICAYGDVHTFGTRRHHVVQPSIVGPLFTRLVDVLLHHYAAVAFRGVVRLDGAGRRPFLPTGLRGDFAADAVWMVELAARGELRRVPGTACAKRVRPRDDRSPAVHRSWERLGRAEVVARWADHCAACAHTALAHVTPVPWREIVVAAAQLRLVGAGRARDTGLRLRGTRERAAATLAFRSALGEASPATADLMARALAYPEATALRDAAAAATPWRRAGDDARRWLRRLAGMLR